MKNTLLKVSAGAASFLAPALALAQQPDTGVIPTTGQNALGIIGVISNILSILIPILITVAVLWVMYGALQYIMAGDDEKAAKAKGTILHGIIALFVMVSIWGLVAILNNTFGVGQGGTSFEYCQEVYDPSANGGVGDFVVPIECE